MNRASCVCRIVKHSSFHPNKADWVTANRLIDDVERERIRQLKIKQDAKASLFAQLLMRQVISDNWRLGDDEYRIRRTKKGKPYAERTDSAKESAEPETITSFNAAHSDHYTVVAAEKSGLIGVDLMKAAMSSKRFEDHRRRRKTMTEFEWSLIEQPAAEAEKIATFMRIWCLKEAYYKATGEGIFAGLKNLECDLQTTPGLSFETPFASQIHRFGTKIKRSGALLHDWIFEEIYFTPKQNSPIAEAETSSTHHVITIARRTEAPTEKHPVTFVELTEPSFLIKAVAANSKIKVKSILPDSELLWEEYVKKQEVLVRKFT